MTRDRVFTDNLPYLILESPPGERGEGGSGRRPATSAVQDVGRPGKISAAA